MSNHYNVTRSAYYRYLDQSSRPGVGLLPFVGYALEGFVDGLKGQIDTIKSQQWEVAWRQFVYDSFPVEASDTDKRRRDLALEIAACIPVGAAVSESKIQDLSVKVARMYAGKTLRTIHRDILRLEELRLVRITKDGVQPDREVILQFLPKRRSG